MKTALLSQLEEAIELWMNENCEEDYWTENYVYSDLSKDMAKAAEMVFDACDKGQSFLKEQEGE